MINAALKMSPNLTRLFSNGVEVVAEAKENSLNKVCLEAERVIKQPGYCPVDTGNLRAGHQSDLSNQDVKRIVCSVYYWFYVVYGTCNMAPNNYLERTISTLIANGFIGKTAQAEIHAAITGERLSSTGKYESSGGGD